MKHDTILVLWDLTLTAAPYPQNSTMGIIFQEIILLSVSY